MFCFWKKSKRKFRFDKNVLKKNDISLLNLDERWNNLFTKKKKSIEIIRCEKRITELLKLQSRLINESKGIGTLKKKCIDRILALTTEAFEKNSETARKDIKHCEKEIKRMNKRLVEIEKKLDEIPEALKEVNLELLEHTVNIIYRGLQINQKKKEKLDKIIEETKARLKAWIEEKELLMQENNDVYAYFHDLLGGEELEKLDRIHFKQ